MRAATDPNPNSNPTNPALIITLTYPCLFATLVAPTGVATRRQWRLQDLVRGITKLHEVIICLIYDTK